MRLVWSDNHASSMIIMPYKNITIITHFLLNIKFHAMLLEENIEKLLLFQLIILLLRKEHCLLAIHNFR